MFSICVPGVFRNRVKDTIIATFSNRAPERHTWKSFEKLIRDDAIISIIDGKTGEEIYRFNT